MYFTRVLLSIVFLLFASTALAVNVDPDRDADDCVVRSDSSMAANSVEAPHGGTGGGEVDDVLNTVRPSGGTPVNTTYPIIQLRPEERDVDAPTVKSQITPEESASALEPSTEMPKTQGMNVSSRMVAMWGGAALAQDTFRCTVESVVNVGADGKFVDDEAFKVVIGDVISIDRQTGKIEGTLSNYNSNGEPRVLDFGSKAQKFKAITVYEPNNIVDYIEITTWDHKPFVYKKRGTVLTGRCE